MTRNRLPNKFKLFPRSKGFRLEVESLPPVNVVLHPTGFGVCRSQSKIAQLRLFSDCGFGCNYDCECQSDHDQKHLDSGGEFENLIPELWFPYLGPNLLETTGLVSAVVSKLLEGEAKSRSKAVQRMLSNPIRQECRRLRFAADASILAVQKAAFHSTCGVETLFLDSRLYQNSFLVRDLLNYPAASAAVSVAPKIVWKDLVGDRIPKNRHVLQELVIEAIEDWQGLLSPTRMAYRSLRRTLMRFPGRIPFDLLPVLADVMLERPVFDRVELIALLQAHQCAGNGKWANCRTNESVRCIPKDANVRCFMHAKRSQLCRTMRLIAEELGCVLSPRKACDIRFMARYAMTYPEPFSGCIEGLARRSISWHRGYGDQVAAAYILGDITNPDSSIQPPPVALPDDPDISFLGTVSDIYREAIRMQHCVGQLAQQAVAGNCFLFHCEHKKHRATIQVNRLGQVVQAQGPMNGQNSAADYGTRVLSAWGKRIASYHLMG